MVDTVAVPPARPSTGSPLPLLGLLELLAVGTGLGFASCQPARSVAASQPIGAPVTQEVRLPGASTLLRFTRDLHHAASLEDENALRLFNAGFSFLVCHFDCTVQSKPSSKIGASAVSAVAAAQSMTTTHEACDQSSGSKFSECMMAQMAKSGAPADAVQFTRELHKQSHGEFGLMTGFQDEGPVAFAWITYPLRANTNYGLLLLTGSRASSTSKISNCLTLRP